MDVNFTLLTVWAVNDPIQFIPPVCAAGRDDIHLNGLFFTCRASVEFFIDLGEKQITAFFASE